MVKTTPAQNKDICARSPTPRIAVEPLKYLSRGRRQDRRTLGVPEKSENDNKMF